MDARFDKHPVANVALPELEWAVQEAIEYDVRTDTDTFFKLTVGDIMYVLLSKHCDPDIDYCGFTIPAKNWYVGYGLDLDEQFRTLTAIETSIDMIRILLG